MAEPDSNPSVESVVDGTGNSIAESALNKHDYGEGYQTIDQPVLSVEIDSESRYALRSGQTHRFPIALDAQEFIQFTAIQRGVDISLELVDSNGVSRIAVDSPNGKYGPELLRWIALPGEHYRLDVHADLGAGDGVYSLRVDTLRQATDRDKQLLRAEVEFLEGKKLCRSSVCEPEALRRFTRAMAEFERLGELERIAMASYAIARIRDARGEAGVAARSFEQALDAYRQLGRDRDIRRTLNSLSKQYRLQGRTAKAMAGLEKALALELTAGDDDIRGLSLLNLGRCLAQIGSIDGALARYGEADRVLRSSGAEKLLPDLRNNTGWLLLDIGDPERALSSFRQALDSAWDTPRATAVAQVGIAKALAELGQIQKAIKFLHEAEQLQTSLGDKQELAIIRNNLAALQLGQGLFDSAEGLLKLALPELPPGDRGAARLNLGYVHMARGHLVKALEAFEDARTNLAKASRVDGQQQAAFFAAVVLQQLGNLELAESRVGEAIELIEHRRRRIGNQRTRATYFASALDPYSLRVRLLLEKNRLEPDRRLVRLAFEAAESRKARTLHDRLLERGSDVPQRESEARGLLSANPINVKEIRSELLDENTALLLFLVADEVSGSTLWLLTREDLVVRTLPERSELASLVEQIRHAMTGAYRLVRRQQAHERLQSVADVLLGDAYQIVADHQRLLLVADDVLHYLPFAALPLPSEFERANELHLRLGLRHQLVLLPSASVGVRLRRRAKPKREDGPPQAFILADPVFGPHDPRANPIAAAHRLRAADTSFSRLRGTHTEALALQAQIGSGQALVFLGFQATKEALVNRDLTPFDVVHFATHGIADSSSPDLSRLVLAARRSRGAEGPENLSAQEIARLDLAADLVVLSACQTALGAKIPGEGVVGLTQAFLESGAGCVLSSLWDAQDDITIIQMQSFYRALIEDGQAPAEALRQVHREMSKSDRWSAPYNWANFIVAGDCLDPLRALQK